MDTQTEQTSPEKRFPWISIIIVLIVILAGYQWFSTRGTDDGVPVQTATESSNTYGTDTPSVPVSPGTPSAPTPAAPLATTTKISNTPTKNNMHTISIETNKGTVVFETYDADAPKTVANFISLAGKGFYSNVIFHRVIKDFMIQGGDPTGIGTGGPGYKFEDELNPATESYKKGYIRGTVAMANSGPDTNGSQFFIMHKDVGLPNNYTIFGRVVKGIEVVDAITATATNESDRPLQDVVIKKVTVEVK